MKPPPEFLSPTIIYEVIEAKDKSHLLIRIYLFLKLNNS